MQYLDGLTAQYYLLCNSVSGIAGNNPFLLQCFTLIVYFEILLRALLIMLVLCPFHAPVCMPMYGLSLSQSDQRLCYFHSSMISVDHLIHSLRYHFQACF